MITKIKVISRDPSPSWSNYTRNLVEVTDDKGKVSEVVYSHEELEIEELRLKMIKAGASPEDLERFGYLHHNAGEREEAELHAGESL